MAGPTRADRSNGARPRARQAPARRGASRPAPERRPQPQARPQASWPGDPFEPPRGPGGPGRPVVPGGGGPGVGSGGDTGFDWGPGGADDRPGGKPPRGPRPGGGGRDGNGRGGNGRGGNGRGGRGSGGGGRGPGGPGGRGPDGPGRGGGGGRGPGDSGDAHGAAGGPSGERGAARRRKDIGRKRSLFWRLRRPIFLIGLAMLAMLAGVGVVVARTELPDIDDSIQASYICAADVGEGQCRPDNAMTRLQSDDGNRIHVPLAEIPPIVQQAVLAVEDRDFYEHDGVNPEGIMRAMFQNARARSVQQGGSTITQQYVLNSFDLARDGGVGRKLKEAVLSIKLEQQMSKDEILDGYLNEVFFGRGSYGVGAASLSYFGIDVRAITDPGQAALLAGLIRAPSAAEPSEDPEEATRRRHTALIAMREEGYITQEQQDLAEAIPVAEPWVAPKANVTLTASLRGTDPSDYLATDQLSTYIEQELLRIDPVRFTAESIREDGLRVYTSINYDLQRAAWQALTTTLDQEDDPNTPEWEGDPEAAIVAVDDQGLVRAMVGSRHQYDPVGQNGTPYATNYAVRTPGANDGFQPGSTFKPIVLAQALRDGYSLKSRYNAQGRMEFPEWTDEDGDPIPVSNYSDSGAGAVMDMIEATKQSSNTAYAQLMLSLGVDPVDPDGDGLTTRSGPEKVAELAEAMGIGGGDGGIPQHQRTPAMVLGTVSATPLEMAGAYSTFANRGTYIRPDIVTRVEQVDDDGDVTVLYQRQVQGEDLLSPTQADLITHALRGVIDDGTGTNAALDRAAAGKTGTAQDNKASWFAGYVPGMTAAVWMGYPDATYDDDGDPATASTLWPMNDEGRPVHGRDATGGSFPAEMWRKFMEVAVANNTAEFVEPTEDQIRSGEVINEDGLQTPDETVPPPADWPGPDFPGDITLPSIPGRPGNTTPSTTRPGGGSTTSTTDPDDTPDPTTTPPSSTPQGQGGSP